MSSSTERFGVNLSKGYLLALVTVFAVLSYLLVLPFVQYVLLGILIAYVLTPLHRRLAPRTSPTISAFALIVFAVAIFFVPFAVVIAAVAGDAASIVSNLDPEALQLGMVESRIQNLTGREVDIAGAVADSGQQIGMILVEQSTTWFSAAIHALVGLGLALFLIYYLLRDGRELMGWLYTTSPLPDDVQSELYEEFDDVMAAVLLGHVLIAIIQGGIAGIGLFVTGIPNAAFWTFVMIILALIPLVGSFLIWGPAIGYLLFTGEPVFAAGLAVYCLIVVSLSDDYLRPVLVDRYADLNPAIIILGVLGGVYAFGVMGLFFGPVVLGALLATVNVVTDYYDDLDRERADI